jgi:hypothetical protein
LCACTVAAAQSRAGDSWPVSGTVVDSAGAPIPGARVQVLGLGRGVVTAEIGRFRIDSILAGRQRLLVRAIGFELQSPVVDVKTGEGWTGTIILARRVQTLPELEVEAEREVSWRLEGFEFRRKHGLGVYLTEEEIKQRFVSNPLHLLQGIAGVRVTNSGVAFARCKANVAYWVDGIRYRDGIPGYVSPATIVGVEVYRGVAQLPAEFLDDACAAVVIWTR